MHVALRIFVACLLLSGAETPKVVATSGQAPGGMPPGARSLECALFMRWSVCLFVSRQHLAAGGARRTWCQCHRITRSLLLERGVEGPLAGGEVVLLDQRARFGRAELAVHAAIFPLHRQRTVVADTGKRAEDRPPLDAAVAGRYEVPAAPRIAKVEV